MPSRSELKKQAKTITIPHFEFAKNRTELIKEAIKTKPTIIITKAGEPHCQCESI